MSGCEQALRAKVQCSPRTWGFLVGAVREPPLQEPPLRLIRDRMAGLDMDQQIELRAKVKRALEEGGEPDL